MDSYGIHNAQLQGNSMAGYVNSYNDQVRAHNKAATDAYMKVKGDASSTKELLDAHLGGMTAFDSLSGLHGAFQTYKATQKYGGLGNSLVRGTQANLHAMTGGRLGQIAMGPNEAAARGVEQGEYNLTAGAKKGAMAMKGAVARSGALGTSAIGTQRTADAEASVQRGAENLEAQAPSRASQVVGHVTEDVAEGQAEDRALGVGWEKAGAQSDPAKSLYKIGQEAKVGGSDEGLGLEGKIFKKGLVKAGVDEGVAHTIGAVSGAVTSAGMGIETAVSDFGDGGAKWKSMDKEQKWGQGFDLASSVVGVADTFVPELAPVSAILGGIGAALDLAGGSEAEKSKVSSAQTTAKTSQEATISQPSVKGTVATSTGQTALQKVGGSAPTSSY